MLDKENTTMIYGNKLLNTDNLAMITLEQDLYNINLLLDESVVITESFDFGEIIDKMFTKIKEVLIKILNAISNIVNKILPAGYKAIQKLIADIINSMKKNKREKINYQGQDKEYTVLNLTKEMQKITKDVANAGFDNVFKEIDNIYNKFSPSLSLDEDQLKEKVMSVNNSITEYNKELEEMLNPYEDFLSTDNDKYLEEYKQHIRSAQDYDSLKKFLEDMADENLKWSNILKDISFEIESSIKSIKTIGSIKNGHTELAKRAKEMNDNIKLSAPKASLISDIPKIFSKVIEIYSKAIKSEIKVVNEISKFERYYISSDIIVKAGD